MTFKLPITSDPPMSTRSCKLVLTDLKADLNNNKSDCYLIIFAPFIERGIRSPIAKKVSFNCIKFTIFLTLYFYKVTTTHMD